MYIYIYICQEKINGKKHVRNLCFLQLLPHLIKSDLKNAVFNNEQQKLTEGNLMRHRN